MTPFRTILHPTDFSERSEAALRLAASLARDGGRLVALHVLPAPAAAGVEAIGVLDEGPARAALEGLALDDSPGPGRPVATLLRRGDAATEILRAAEEVNADLIVLGTHGRSGLARAVVGSVAEEVLRRAPCPVLAVRVPVGQEAPHRPRTILHPTDFSEAADAALRQAVALAAQNGARLILLHVPPASETPVWVYDHMAGTVPDRGYLAEKFERHTAELRAANPQVIFDRRLGSGPPAEEILRTARAEACDLIIMGTHGRRGFERALFGSVAEEVLRNAPCPVMVAPAPKTHHPAPATPVGGQAHA